MSNSNKPHVHAEVIKAWADGKQIQYWSSVREVWIDANNPSWEPGFSFRVKPETIRYRVVLFQAPGGDPYTDSTESETVANKWANSNINFVRWLTDWIEVEV